MHHLVRLVRVADLFDIALVSLFLYAVLTWFKKTASRSVLVGISVLAVVYFSARAFDMYLTQLLFQAVFAVLLVAVVVVFQEDLRRLFERVATLGTLQERFHTQAALSHLDTIVEVSADLAARRIGALLVMKGREPLDRHIEGGVLVDGEISKALLDSIFDPHSMGHDGAVILEHDRLRRFGVHLPLSHNLREIGQRGTRHAAALGVSERTDALVIVVSEERGQISVARQGKLTPLSSSADLQRVLDQFNQELFPQSTESTARRVLRENAALKAVSVLLACMAWFLVNFRAGTVQQSVTVPIEYRNPPDGMVIDDTAPSQARVTFGGFERAFSLLNTNALKISLDMSGLQEGVQKISIDDSDIKRPSNLDVYQVDPTTISLEAHSVVSAALPVEVRTTGRLPPDLQLLSATANPKTVAVRIWKTRASTTVRIFTEPIDLSQVTTTTTLKATLVPPSDVRFPEGTPPDVSVTLQIGKVQPAK
ncbi:MAG: diadenylate cyclase [Planctomycetia bacterium]|nr:diadenylate cyclase [Planctomycetia bacterium]